MARNLYDLENVIFQNKADEETANEFLKAGLSFQIDKNSLLWTEGGVFIGYVVLIDETNKKEMAGLFKITYSGKIINC